VPAALAAAFPFLRGDNLVSGLDQARIKFLQLTTSLGTIDPDIVGRQDREGIVTVLSDFPFVSLSLCLHVLLRPIRLLFLMG